MKDSPRSFIIKKIAFLLVLVPAILLFLLIQGDSYNNDLIKEDNNTMKDLLSYIDVTKRMTDLEGLSVPPLSGETCSESSSYEKLSKYNEETGEYENWGANEDKGYDAPRSEDGGYIISEMEGPGAIVRIWSADPKQGHIKIFIDGSDKPEIDMPFIDLFGTGESPFNFSELCYESGRGKNCYVPITYNKSCKVVLYDDWGMYYHVNYITFSEGTQVEPFSFPLTRFQYEALRSVNDCLANASAGVAGKYENETSNTKTVTIPSGGSIDILNTETSGAVTGIKIKINNINNPGEDWKALSDMTFSAFWDTEESPSVWSTLGGFFASITGLHEYTSFPMGVETDGTMYCNWYMPFEKGAVIKIGNDGDIPYEITYETTSVPLSSKSASQRLRFHAKWNRAKDPVKKNNDRWPDSQFLYTEGKGRFVGTSLHIYKEIGTGDPAYEPSWWWGEGDEKFFVDGEKFPSWFGTGSEDYFGYAWGTWKPFSAPYHNQPFSNGGMFGIGNRLNNRFHIIDNVPFLNSFDAYLEKYHRDHYANWAFTNYWYLEAGGTDSYAPVSLSERTAYYSHPYPKYAEFIEGEDLIIMESTGMLQAETQDMTPFPADKWSGNSHFILKSHNRSDYVKFLITIPEEGSYKFTARFTKAVDYGIASHYINGKALGKQIDLYAPNVCRTDEIILDTVFLSPGLHEFEMRIVGKNNLSTGHFYGLDYLKIEKS